MLKEKGYSAEALGYIKDDYLSYRGKSKLRSVDYDKDYFNDIIIEGNTEKHSPQTPSQKNILNAKKYFSSELKKLDIEKINSLLDTIKKAEILEVDFDTPKESILMFELQNNRGKELTNMEKLKSYLSYQIYNLCDADADEELKNITQIFEEIYRIVNDIKNISEDDILRYFNISQFGYEYRENDDDKNYKKYLKEKNLKAKKLNL